MSEYDKTLHKRTLEDAIKHAKNSIKNKDFEKIKKDKPIEIHPKMLKHIERWCEDIK